jgi:hypothetical protein
MLVTFDGSCYFSFHSTRSKFSYDFFHANSMFRFFVLNRLVTIHSIDSFVSSYIETLSIPMDDSYDEY